jgi:hypothetical protein
VKKVLSDARQSVNKWIKDSMRSEKKIHKLSQPRMLKNRRQIVARKKGIPQTPKPEIKLTEEAKKEALYEGVGVDRDYIDRRQSKEKGTQSP